MAGIDLNALAVATHAHDHVDIVPHGLVGLSLGSLIVTTVLLIRHGQTSANRSGVLAGRTPGVDLDGTGRRQARSLATRLKRVPLAAIVHSPLERCAQTAGAVAVHHPDVAVHAEAGVIECDYGRWTGQPLTELAKDPLWEQVQRTPSSVTFPGGESMDAMAQRAVRSVGEWVGRFPEGVVAVVSHGDVIKAILSAALGQDLDEFQRIVIGPGSLSIVHYSEHRPAVLRMNDMGRSLPVAPGSGRPTVGGGTG